MMLFENLLCGGALLSPGGVVTKKYKACRLPSKTYNKRLMS